MRTLLLLLLLLPAAPALAEDAPANPEPDSGFPIALVVLAVAAVVLALVWRAVSKRKQNERRD